MKNYKMNFLELQVTLSFCAIFLLRMLGMFMILPVLSKYGITLNGGNKFLIGLSAGIYGFFQAFCQIPFGILSDKYGRKKMIIFGLFAFFLGSLIAANIHNIWGLIIGRAFQGSGAISGVSMAFLSDFVREEHRSKSMAAIGCSFGVSFLIAMVSGPIIVKCFGFFSLFWISAFFSIICIVILVLLCPTPRCHSTIETVQLFHKKIMSFIINPIFLKYYLGVFFLHCLLMINFMSFPNQLELLGYALHDHWILYLSTISFSFLILFFFIFYCKTNFMLKNIIEICIFFICVSEIFFLTFQNNLFFFIAAVQIFFIAFNFLEVFLPSYLSQEIKNNCKGTIMSIYSTSQFLGIFFGGIISGFLCSVFKTTYIFLVEIFFSCIWLIVNIFIRMKFVK